MAIITFLSDFGDSDGYVGIVKGAILGINPEAKIIDLCHNIEPFNISSAAWIIYNAFNHFPEGTIHIAVVDPAVGSQQKRILLTNGSEHFIGPDNGIFSLILEDPLSKRPSADGFRAYELNKPQWYKETPGEKTPAGHEASASFHARDIFGPIAARLSLGIDAAHLGSEIDCAALAALPVLEQSWRSDSIRVGRVMHVDRFGNLITSLPAQEAAAGVFYIGTTRIGALVKTYHSVKPGQLLAFIGSHGFVEVAVCEGNAQRVLGATSNTTVELRAQ